MTKTTNDQNFILAPAVGWVLEPSALTPNFCCQNIRAKKEMVIKKFCSNFFCGQKQIWGGKKIGFFWNLFWVLPSWPPSTVRIFFFFFLGLFLWFLGGWENFDRVVSQRLHHLTSRFWYHRDNHRDSYRESHRESPKVWSFTIHLVGVWLGGNK